MNKTRKRRKKSIHLGLPAGTVVGLAGIVTVLLCLLRVPLDKWLQDGGNAYLSVALGWFLIFLSLGAGGVRAAVSKMVTQRYERGAVGNAKKVVAVAVLLAGMAGLFLSFLLYVSAGFLTGKITGVALAGPALQVMAVGIAPICMTAVLVGGLEGFGFLDAAALPGALRGTIWFFGGIFLAELCSGWGNKVGALLQNTDYGPAYVSFGSAIALVIGAWVGFLVSVVTWLLKRPALRAMMMGKETGGTEPEGRIVQSFWHGRMAGMFFNLLVACFLTGQGILFLHLFGESDATKAIGEWGVFTGKTCTLLSLPLLACIAFVRRQFPGLRLGFERRNSKKSRDKFMITLRCVMLFCVPFAAFLGILARPAVQMLFTGGDTDLAVSLLREGSFGIILFALVTVFGSVLYGMGQGRWVTVGLLPVTVLHFIVLYVLLSMTQLGIHGVILADFFAVVLLGAVYLFFILRSLQLRISWLRIFLAPCIGAIAGSVLCVLLLLALKNFAPAWLVFCIPFLTGCVVYFIAVTILHGVTPTQLREFPGGEILIRLAGKFRVM